MSQSSQATSTEQALQRILNGFSSNNRQDLIRAILQGATGASNGIPTTSRTNSKLVFVASKEDFPAPSPSGAIQLLDNYTYFLVDSVNLEGCWLVGGRNTVLTGGSSENCILSSTGLGPSQALVESQWSLPVQNITFTAQRAIDLDVTGNPNQVLDWFAVNFLNCATIGRIANYNNCIFQTCGILNSQGWEFDGAIGTIGFSQTIFDSSDAGTVIILPATLTVTRRFRIIYSAFVILSGETGLDISDSATIPVEGYILDTVNFAGGGTYITGVAPESNKALFAENRGVKNSASVAYYTMNGNATATVISNTNTPTKVLGTTTLQSSSQKFTSPVSNRATYTGAITREFKATAVLSVTSGNNNQIGIYIAKNGAVLPQSEIYITTSGTGRAEAAKVQVVTEMQENDYLEIWVENATAANNITVTELSVIVEALN